MPDLISPKTQVSLADILRYAAIGGTAGFGLNTLLKVLSNFKQTSENTDIEKDLNRLAQPYKVVHIKPEYIKDKSKLLDPELLEKATIQKEAAEDKSSTNVLESQISPEFEIPLKWGAGIASFLGGLYGANKLFNYVKQKTLKSELEDAKKQYYTSLYLRKQLADIAKEESKKSQSSMYRYASEKTAGEYSWKDILLGGGIGIFGGTLLAHILAARKLAESKNPYIKGRKNIYMAGLTSADMDSPVIKFVIDKDNKEGDDSEVEGMIDAQKSDEGIKPFNSIGEPLKVIKVASAEELLSYLDSDQLFMHDVTERVIKLAAELEKQSLSNGGVNNFINAVALGHIDALKNTDSFESMMKEATSFCEETTKVASEQNKSLAVTFIASDPILSSVFVPYAASEVLEHNPDMDKIASDILAKSPKIASDMLGCVAASNIEEKAEVLKPILEKSASEGNTLVDVLDTADDSLYHDAIYLALTSN